MTHEKDVEKVLWCEIKKGGSCGINYLRNTFTLLIIVHVKNFFAHP